MFDPFSWLCRCLEFAFPKRRFILFVCLNQWSKNPSNIRRRPTPLPLLSAGATCGNPSFAALKLRTGPENLKRPKSRWFPSRVALGCPQFHLDECHHWTTGATYTVYRIPTTDRNNMSKDSLKETQDCYNPKQEEGKTGRVTKPFKCHLITAVLKGWDLSQIMQQTWQ